MGILGYRGGWGPLRAARCEHSSQAGQKAVDLLSDTFAGADDTWTGRARGGSAPATPFGRGPGLVGSRSAERRPRRFLLPGLRGHAEVHAYLLNTRQVWTCLGACRGIHRGA